MFDFSARNGAVPVRPVATVHAGITPVYFETKVKLDTQPLDYTPEKR